MTRIVVSGYASLDRAMLVPEHVGPERTAVVQRRLSRPWPAVGGAAYVARAVAASGTSVALVTWLGDDPGGRDYLARLASDGVDTSPVDVSGQRSPSSYLFYDHEGRAACYFDPGDVADGLNFDQVELATTADWWCLAVGPRPATEQILGSLPDGSSLVWVVKGDPDAFPPETVEALLRRVDVLVFNRAERDFLETSVAADLDDYVGQRTVVIETRGPEGVAYRSGGQHGVVEVDQVNATDPTGAGDTFAGASVAALAAGQDVPSAVSRGVESVKEFLGQSREEHAR